MKLRNFKHGTAKFHLVDQARSKLPVTDGIGTGFEEVVDLNQALLELGKVIRAQGQKNFVSFRENNLTRILEDSLGGNSSKKQTKHFNIVCQDIQEGNGYDRTLLARMQEEDEETEHSKKRKQEDMLEIQELEHQNEDSKRKQEKMLESIEAFSTNSNERFSNIEKAVQELKYHYEDSKRKHEEALEEIKANFEERFANMKRMVQELGHRTDASKRKVDLNVDVIDTEDTDGIGVETRQRKKEQLLMVASPGSVAIPEPETLSPSTSPHPPGGCICRGNCRDNRTKMCGYFGRKTTCTSSCECKMHLVNFRQTSRTMSSGSV
ncbi:unnamed protein product [Ceutorhynchus assimilis]|uniref:Kinesin motor domain-containing protein n=1 Tax=Ceutorhynchus assimilis TaxID=467358 RepID=A0A9N9QPC4_9CUCU|nr:unnamed protein product [Ceutorhynchus assimilis]